jgi:hypothetical protein
VSAVPARRGVTGLPTDYDPGKGLMRIAAAGEAEKRFSRARDSAGLRKAVEIKLTEQWRFVRWWDGQEKRRGTGLPSEITDGRAASDFGLDRDTIHRWRKRLVVKDEPDDTSKLDDAKEAAAARCVRDCETGPGRVRNPSVTGEQDWQTRPEHLDAVRRVMGRIGFDPMSSDKAQERVRADDYRTAERDGLVGDWPDLVFMNPGFAKETVEAAFAKLAAEMDAGRVTEAIALTNNATDTAWCQAAMARADRLCFVRLRIRFLTPAGEEAGTPMQGQMFFYFGPNPDRFEREFGAFGIVVAPSGGREGP